MPFVIRSERINNESAQPNLAKDATANEELTDIQEPGQRATDERTNESRKAEQTAAFLQKPAKIHLYVLQISLS